MHKNLNNSKSLFEWSTIVNSITISRIFMGLPLILSLSYRKYEYSILFLVLGAFTDYLDGYLARIKNCKTILGAKLDPLADKILLLGDRIVQQGLLPLFEEK